MSAVPASVPWTSRRAVLAAAPAALLGAALAACTADRDADGEPAPPPPPDPDDALRSAAAEREQGLLREYDAALAALPALGARLAPLRAHHDEHLRALLGASASTSPEPAASGGGSPSPASSTPAVAVPADPAAALARLVTLERAAGAAHAQACLAASRSLAPVLASLSASELSHPVALA